MITEIQTAAQIKKVCTFARQIWNEHYVPIIGQAQVDYMLEKYQSFAAISSQINKENYRYYLVCKGSKLQSYFAVKMQSGEVFVSKIYVKKSNRGKGIGEEIISFIEKFARENSQNTIKLTVNKNNKNAIEFYKKCGFIVSGTKITDIGSGFVMDDFVLIKMCNINPVISC